MAEGAKRPRLDPCLAPAASDAVLRRVAELLLSEARVKQLADLEELVDDALALAAAHGVVMYKHPEAKAQAATVPFTFLPAPFAADLYGQAMDVAPAFHSLMDKISTSIPWIEKALEATGRMDAISGQLLGICSRVYGGDGKDPSEDIRLHIMRNDFMLDAKKDGAGFPMKQIELNMIAASFATHAEDVTEIHRYILSKYLHRLDGSLTPEALAPVLQGVLPTSPSAQGLAAALAEAHQAYAGRWKASDLPRAVLFVAEADENNEMDHRKLEAALFQGHGVISLRRSLRQLAAHRDSLLRDLEAASVSGIGMPATTNSWQTRSRKPKALIVDGHEVTVAYFRSGYWPGHFPTEACWAVRESVEASEAVKCPSVLAQLAGMKKVQQLLCEAEHLQHFLAPAEAAQLSRTFAAMGDPSGGSEQATRCVQAAMERPEDWVLKPQREGSGELFFGADIPPVLASRSREELAEFILMERVRPPVTPSLVYRAEADKRAEPVVRASVAELGVYGVFVADGSRVLMNKAVGHLLRSKGRHTNQGGVFVGNAVVDAPLLLPPELFWPSISS